VVTELELATLVRAAGDGAGRHLDQGRVQRYAEDFDSLPPVVVFRTGDGLILADGYHRLAAAVRLGRRTVRADLRVGTRREALDFAVAQAVEDRGVTPDQAAAAIARWSQSPPAAQT
jgi:hypothetical protein